MNYRNSTIVLTMLLCLGAAIHAAKNSAAHNELQKIFHHQGNDNNQKPAIELGKIVFYFKQEPIINQLPSNQPNDSQITLFFPSTQATREALSAIVALNSTQNPYYAVHLEAVNKPIKGIKCVINFDPARVSFDYSTFDSIRLNKGIVMRFFNKQILEQISKQDRSVLKVVSNNLRKSSIVIDCGHGGEDHGAIGFFNIKEKDITMKVGLQVADLLKKKGFDVVLTRDGDHTIALDQRTSSVNKLADAQLLISIHANSSPNQLAAGIETFCLNSQLFRSQNRADNELERTAQIYTHTLNKKSIVLAHAVQQSTVNTIKKKHEVADRSVKHSVSQMLIGANIPAALIEIGFVSNKQEAQLLNDHEYQQLIAQGISNGILSYIATQTT